eukprot:596500-Prorocentrum_lima.AAC.1
MMLKVATMMIMMMMVLTMMCMQMTTMIMVLDMYDDYEINHRYHMDGEDGYGYVVAIDGEDDGIDDGA